MNTGGGLPGCKKKTNKHVNNENVSPSFTFILSENEIICQK